MTTEARDLIDQLDQDDRAFLLGWLAAQLDGGRPFTIGVLRDCVRTERASRPVTVSPPCGALS